MHTCGDAVQHVIHLGFAVDHAVQEGGVDGPWKQAVDLDAADRWGGREGRGVREAGGRGALHMLAGHTTAARPRTAASQAAISQPCSPAPHLSLPQATASDLERGSSAPLELQ